MARLPYLRRQDLAKDKRFVYDLINNRRGDINRTCYPLLLNHPEVAEKVSSLGAYVQFSELEPVVRQIGILCTARELNSQFIWTHRDSMARDDGLSNQLIDVIREKQPADSLPSQEMTLVTFAREFLRTHTVKDDTYSDTVALLGIKGTIDFSLVIGFYAMLIPMISALLIDLPDDLIPLLPM